jgi:hypothetical protein
MQDCHGGINSHPALSHDHLAKDAAALWVAITMTGETTGLFVRHMYPTAPRSMARAIWFSVSPTIRVALLHAGSLQRLGQYIGCSLAHSGTSCVSSDVYRLMSRHGDLQ